MQVIHHYFTSNQSSTDTDLGLDMSAERTGAYNLVVSLGTRLRRAMGEEEILSRYHGGGGEFRVPTFRAYAETLDRDPWTVLDCNGKMFRVIAYQEQFEGWKKMSEARKARGSLLCTTVSPYEYAYELWDEHLNLRDFHPDLFQDGTFGVWLSLLPQPVSVILSRNAATITWAAGDPRVHRSHEMGRYLLSEQERSVTCHSTSWRRARAEAYVMAWEKMAAHEPPDRYREKILAQTSRR